MELKDEIDVDAVTYFNINRQNVLDGAIRALKRRSFNVKARIDINFSDILTGLSEDGIDAGGPTREFLRLLMDAIVVYLKAQKQLRYFPATRQVSSHLRDHFYGSIVLWYFFFPISCC